MLWRFGFPVNRSFLLECPRCGARYVMEERRVRRAVCLFCRVRLRVIKEIPAIHLGGKKDV